MRAVASGRDVLLYFSWDDETPAEFLPVLEELAEANHEVEANRGDLGSASLGPFLGRQAAAQSDMDDLFSERLTIEQAERLHAALYGAIISAKVATQVFAYTDGD